MSYVTVSRVVVSLLCVLLVVAACGPDEPGGIEEPGTVTRTVAEAEGSQDGDPGSSKDTEETSSEEANPEEVATGDAEEAAGYRASQR